MKGSCLCGACAYEVKALVTPISHCACQTCRKAHAAAFNTSSGVLPEDFAWLRGSEHLHYYESSPGKKRYFCRECGTHLVAIKEGAPYYVLRLGSLDDDPEQRPQRFIWTSHEAPWMYYQGALQRFDEWAPKPK